ncbi:MAG: glycosyltransferase family 9 protein [Solirubrobacterales bacterium]|nr:glycosyltransferase family 9 protein [Solirubrobacterales bacterium]
MPKRFLISRLSALGDVVCSLPVACALRATFPDCEITWVVDGRFAGIVECCPAVNHVVKSRPGFKPRTWPKLEGEFDAALDLQGLLKSSLVVARARAAQKVGYHWQREGSWLFSQAVKPDPTSFHIVDQYVDVARAIGAEAHRAEFGLVTLPEDVDSVRAKLATKGVAGKFVAVNAGAGWATKRWPPTHVAKLNDLLSAQGLPCVLIGGKATADVSAAEEVLAAAKVKPVWMLGETNVRELVALIALGSAHVGGDTGSTHIAAALGVPAVGLYSITRPERSCPYGQVERCHYDPAGLANIEPDRVFLTVMEALA